VGSRDNGTMIHDNAARVCQFGMNTLLRVFNICRAASKQSSRARATKTSAKQLDCKHIFKGEQQLFFPLVFVIVYSVVVLAKKRQRAKKIQKNKLVEINLPDPQLYLSHTTMHTDQMKIPPKNHPRPRRPLLVEVIKKSIKHYLITFARSVRHLWKSNIHWHSD
jgi:hypothetical protein